MLRWVRKGGDISPGVDFWGTPERNNNPPPSKLSLIDILLNDHLSIRLLLKALTLVKFNLSPSSSMTGDLTKDNLRAIATPTSTIALSVAPLVSSAPVDLDNIPDNGTYFDGINF